MNRSLLLLFGHRTTRRFSLRSVFTNNSAEPNGFTLMELLIVMAIIAILMLIAIPTVGALKKSRQRTFGEKVHPDHRAGGDGVRVHLPGQRFCL